MRNRRVLGLLSRSAIGLSGAALVASAAVAMATAGSPEAGALAPERIAQLNEMVREDCGSCHGMTLKGGLGRPLLPEYFEGRDKETIAGIILDGIPGTAMPPWRGLLSEAEVAWIASALKDGQIK
ncbi:MAG TPA: cytochrome c [Hyphomicrobiales bacterium]|nr:cytochrome c [Kaistiaceae bacterium]HQF31592.1 cytochrome c [Hyphomicrobiales bacterium]